MLEALRRRKGQVRLIDAGRDFHGTGNLGLNPIDGPEKLRIVDG